MADVAVVPERPEAGAPSSGSSRSVARRPALPNGRAIVGGFLVAVSALGIFTAYARATAGPTTSYVVARHDLALGTQLSDDDLITLPMELPAAVARHAAFNRTSAVIGATTIGPIRQGELVQAGDLVRKRSGPAELEISFEIEPARALAGTLRPGELVDVLATFGAGSDAYTVVVVQQARVLASTSSKTALAAGGDVISLALASSDAALALTHAVNAGEVTLVRSTGSTVSGPAGQTYRVPAAGSDRP
jgi:Flp pilus assembly protein CpaB